MRYYIAAGRSMSRGAFVRQAIENDKASREARVFTATRSTVVGSADARRHAAGHIVSTEQDATRTHFRR